MQHNYVKMRDNYVNMRHVNIIMLHANIDKSQVNIIMLHVDIMCLACRGQKNGTIQVSVLRCLLNTLFSREAFHVTFKQ